MDPPPVRVGCARAFVRAFLRWRVRGRFESGVGFCHLSYGTVANSAIVTLVFLGFMLPE